MDLLIATLGVFAAGGAVVPLDPAHPQERLEYTLEDSGAVVALRDGDLEPRQGRSTVARGGNPGRGLPDHLGYIIYTSGTTGRPKGIALTQRALVNMARWHIAEYGGGRRMLGFTSFSFDVFFQELLTTLASGGSFHLISEETRRDAEAMARVIEEERIEEALVAVVVLQQLAEAVEEQPERLASLRWVTTVGEALKITPAVVRLFEALPQVRLRNFYGPAETHGITAHTLSGPPASWPATAPIGRPIANTQIHILDRNGELTPAIVPGDLHIGGIALARGYAGRPDLTAERFVPDPFSATPGGRLYRTGDLARWRPDGVIEFLGRLDHQVKIRGIRVEPAEIEAALVRHPVVREAVVLVQDEGGPTGKRLVAYLVTDGEALDPGALRSFLARSLPEVMLPALYVPLDALPLTPHGKVDRRLLARLGAEAAPEAERQVVLPRDSMEESVSAIWEEVLGIEGPSVHDNFFSLGGHSLLATQLLSRVRKSLGAELPLRDLFEAPTIAEMAARVRELTAGMAVEKRTALVRVQPHGERPPLVLVHPVGGHVLCYAPLAEQLGPDQPLLAFESTGEETTIEAMAERYLAELQRVQPAGPYHLGGWSMGGLIAFEMARKLTARGAIVDRVVLFDTTAPGRYGEPPEEPTLLLGFAGDLLARLDLGVPAELAAAVRTLGVDRGLALLQAEARRHGLPLDVDEARRLFHVFTTNFAALFPYTGGPYAGRVVLFRPEGATHDTAADWRALAPDLEILPMPGDHHSMLRTPHVAVVADALSPGA
jgi:amino acid adenylation domain-containing protein